MPLSMSMNVIVIIDFGCFVLAVPYHCFCHLRYMVLSFNIQIFKVLLIITAVLC